MKRILLAATAAALLLGACGDDGDSLSSGGGADLSGEERALADDIKASLLMDSEDDFAVSDADADCIATGMVDRLGVDAFDGIDFDTPDPEFALSADQADEAARVMVDCVDIAPLLADTFAEDGSLSESSAQCMADAFDDDLLVSMFSSFFQGAEEPDDPDLIRTITQAMTECLTDEELAEVTG